MTRKDRITILGYGSQGKAIALNLRDSGYKVMVGLRGGSQSIRKARGQGIKTASVRGAVKDADIIIIAIPDHAQHRVLGERLFRYMECGPSLVFLHGSSIHFKLVRPPGDLPVLLLAPPFSAFYGVYQGHTKKGYALLTKLAGAIGIRRKHLIKTTFAEEAVGDLFGEQAILCGGLARLLKCGYETLVEAGLSPQNAYLEVAYQIDLIVELVKEHGLSGMFSRISPMARYGSVVNGPRVITSDVKANMKKVLAEIESGEFILKAGKAGMKSTQKQMDQVTNIAFDRQAKKFSKG
jgi:ketol-acid reductoisomerase